MELLFAEHEDVVFERAPLVSVLTQIRFEPILSLTSDEGVAGFQEGLRRDYPFLSREVDTEIRVDGNGQGVGVRQQMPIWRLQDGEEGDRNWQVSITVGWIALEVLNYSDFSEFRSRLSRVLDVLQRTISPSKSKRLGLRKVNHFEHPSIEAPSDWAELLNPRLLGLASDKGLPVEPSQTFNVAEFGGDDGRQLRVIHGVPGEPEYHLKYSVDCDCFSENRYPIVPGSPLLDVLQSYSETITSFFHWTLTERMRKYLEPKPRKRVA